MVDTLILLRHERSQANAERIFTGPLDVSLSEAGRKGTEGAALLLDGAGHRPPIGCCSPLLRTRRAATIPTTRMRHLPRVRKALPLLGVAHGNSLRGLRAVLGRLNEEGTRVLNSPIGRPLVCRIGADGRPLGRGGTYLDRAAAIAAAVSITR